jgi:hypothetical protein
MFTTDQLRAAASSKIALTVFASVVSAALGAAAGYRIGARQVEAEYSELMAKEIEEAKNFYIRASKSHPYETPSSAAEALGVGLEVEEAADALLRYQGVKPAQTKAHVVVDADGTSAQFEKTEPVIAQNHNVFADSKIIDYDFDPSWMLDPSKEDRSSDTPYVITKEEFLRNEPEYEQFSLSYFEADDVLIDPDDDPVADRETLVGDANLTQFGEGSGDPNIVYVRCESVETDWEIARHEGSYTKQVLGFIEHSHQTTLRKFRPDRE